MRHNSHTICQCYRPIYNCRFLTKMTVLLFSFVLQVILAIIAAWVLAAILTATDKIPEGTTGRTDFRATVLRDSPWFYIPYPCKFLFLHPHPSHLPLSHPSFTHPTKSHIEKACIISVMEIHLPLRKLNPLLLSFICTYRLYVNI